MDSCDGEVTPMGEGLALVPGLLNCHPGSGKESKKGGEEDKKLVRIFI